LHGAPALPGPKPWLTPAEAADYSGLSRAWLLKQAREGGYGGGMNLGTEKNPRWMFNRDALTQIGKREAFAK